MSKLDMQSAPTAIFFRIFKDILNRLYFGKGSLLFFILSVNPQSVEKTEASHGHDVAMVFKM